MWPRARRRESGDVQCQAQVFAQLRGDQAADDGAGGPSGFEIAEAARAGVKNVAGQGDEHDVGADDSGHQNGMSDAQSAHQRLLLEVVKTFAQVGVHGEREAGFGDFGIFAGGKRFGGGFGGFGIFAILLTWSRGRDVAAAHLVEAKCGDEIGDAVDGQNAGDAGAVVGEADEGSGDEAGRSARR